MGLLGKILIRIAFSVTIVALFVFEVLLFVTVAEMFNAVVLIFTIISANILFERYLSKEEQME